MYHLNIAQPTIKASRFDINCFDLLLFFTSYHPFLLLNFVYLCYIINLTWKESEVIIIMISWFNTLDNTAKIELFIGIVSLFTSIVAIVISVLTLKQSSNAIIESSRANIMFYIDTLTGGQNYLVLKNFGNSSGKILNIDISPSIQYSKLPDGTTMSAITEFSNITLAPNQYIKSWFDFKNYPDKIFDVTLKYETLGKVYTENYTLNISYINSIDCLNIYRPDMNDEKDVLIRIANSLLRLNERL